MILSNYYKICSKVADVIPDWRTKNINDLINDCIRYESDATMHQGCVAAVYCRKWPSIGKYYFISKGSATPEDCFEWLGHAVMYALEHRKWLDPNSSLYGDPNGPDKVLNRCIISTRHIYYQANNNDNRKINFGLESLQNLEEEELSYVIPPSDVSGDSIMEHFYIKEMIRSKFNSNHPMQSFVLDGIVNGSVFDSDKDGKTTVFSKRKLAKHLRNIDERYCKLFSVMYNVDETQAKDTVQDIKSLSGLKLYKIIDQAIETSRRAIERELAL